MNDKNEMAYQIKLLKEGVTDSKTFLKKVENTIRNAGFLRTLYAFTNHFDEYQDELFDFLFPYLVNLVRQQGLTRFNIDLGELLNRFPNHAEKVFQEITQPLNIESFIKNLRNLNTLISFFSNHKEVLFNYFALEAPKLLQHSSSQDLAFLVYDLPEYKEAIFQIITQPANMRIIISKISDLQVICRAFKTYEKELFKYLIKKENFDNLIKNNEDLLHAQYTFFPNTFLRSCNRMKLDAPCPKSSYYEVVTIYQKQEAFTQGATAGALSNILPIETSFEIGFFLNRKDGVSLALTCKEAVLRAEDNMSKIPDL